MKKITITYLILFLLQTCNGQDKSIVTYPKKKIMNTEKIDLTRFENRPDVVNMEQEKNLPSMIDTLSDGTVVHFSSWDNKEDNYNTYYTKSITPPPPQLFFTTQDFYPSGTIKEETKSFIGTLLVPPFYNSLIIKEYDNEGKLIKTTDNTNFDLNVKLKFTNLLEILQKTPIIQNVKDADRENYRFYLFHQEIDKEDITADKIIKKLLSKDCNGTILNPKSDVDRRNITISLDRNEWKITKDVYPQGYFDYILNANTGELKDVNYRGDKRP